VLLRAATYAALFIGFVLVFLPARVLSRAGVRAPAAFGARQLLGAAVTLAGGVLALGCVCTLTVVGRGTPAPFDPPRRLVDRGPYAWIRNPMYVGAVVALLGAALYYGSWALGAFALAFLLVAAAFVRLYEEPTLRRMFGAEYAAYCARVGRWWPLRSRTRLAPPPLP